MVLAQESGSGLLGGPELLPWIVLALGGAMVVGNVLALTRPPTRPEAGDDVPVRAPLARTLVMMGVGLVASLWAIASLLTG